MTDELKPCPFCAKMVDLVSTLTSELARETTGDQQIGMLEYVICVYIRCASCSGEVRRFGIVSGDTPDLLRKINNEYEHTRAEAIKLWNQRTP